jgi:uncharacterized membrane protein (TIGR02234 family)
MEGATVTRVSADVGVGWPTVAVVAGLLAVSVGGFVVVRGRTWPGMGRRYERTGAPGTASPAATTAAPARPQTDEDRTVEAWKALDRGEDPTATGDDRRDV